MSLSSEFRGGKLKLKGNRSLFKSDPSKKKKKKAGEGSTSTVDHDSLDRGGWRRIVDELDLKGGVDIVIECGDFSRCYLAAQDNGRFVVGARHFTIGEPPSPEEILSLIKTPDDPKMSLKTGFGKYVGVDSEGILVAMADAIGPRERFELIFQDGKSALQSSSSNLFLKMNPVDDDFVRVCSRVVGEHEIINIRTNAEKAGPMDWRSTEDKKLAGDCETAYLKMYQHSRVETKNKMISYDVNDKQSVKTAQEEGNLHETLLNRRQKLKSDKYC